MTPAQTRTAQAAMKKLDLAAGDHMEAFFAAHAMYDLLQELIAGPKSALPENSTPIETIQYWADSYSSQAGGSHAMVANMLREYLTLRQTLAAGATELEAQTNAKGECASDICYSTDGEIFYNNFSAIQGDLDIGSSYFVGEPTEPTIEPQSLGEHVEEYISEQLDEQIGEVAQNFKLTPTNREILGNTILAKIAALGGFHCYSVTNVKACVVTADDLGSVVANS